MNGIRRATPTRDVGWSMFDDDFGGLLEGFFKPTRMVTTRDPEGDRAPAIDVTETDKTYVVKADLPGIKKDDINVTVHDGILTISAETSSDTETKDDDKVIRRERRYGKYYRSMSLNQQVDENAVKASYTDGVLELTLPKKEAHTPKKITVNV